MNIYHRYFIQYMLKHGVASVDNSMEFCRHVSKGNIDSLTQFKTMIIEVNREISKQFYKIVLNTCEVTNQNLVVWLNMKNDDISKLQISYSELELEYFHAILQEIIGSPDYRITFIVCINITSSLTASLSRENGQKVLNKWLKGGYYIKNGDFIYLGTRTILEFTSYLRSCCPDSVCNLCSELVFTGKKCGSCFKVLHSYCMSKYLNNQTKCPCCKNIWNEIDDGINHNMNVAEDDNDSNGEEPQRVVKLNTMRENRNRSSQQSLPDESSTDNEDAPGPSRRKRHR